MSHSPTDRYGARVDLTIQARRQPEANDFVSEILNPHLPDFTAETAPAILDWAYGTGAEEKYRSPVPAGDNPFDRFGADPDGGTPRKSFVGRVDMTLRAEDRDAAGTFVRASLNQHRASGLEKSACAIADWGYPFGAEGKRQPPAPAEAHPFDWFTAAKVLSLRETTRRLGREIIEGHRYDSPGLALRECSVATRLLQGRIGDAVSYRVNVRIEDDLSGTAWAQDSQHRDDPSHAWHWVLAVPTVGIVDLTGTQFGKEPLRIFREVPEDWTLVRAAKPSEPAPDPVDVWRPLCSGDPVSARNAFDKLLSVDQVDLYD